MRNPGKDASACAGVRPDGQWLLRARCGLDICSGGAGRSRAGARPPWLRRHQQQRPGACSRAAKASHAAGGLPLVSVQCCSACMYVPVRVERWCSHVVAACLRRADESRVHFMPLGSEPGTIYSLEFDTSLCADAQPQVFSVGGAAANAGTQRAAGAQLPDQALGAAARQGHSTLVTYGGVGGATGGTVLTRTAWWAAGGGLAALPGPQGSLLISLVSPAEPMAQQGLDAPGAFKVASSSEDAHALPSAGRQRHSAADAIQAAARSDPWWEGSHLAKGLAQRLNRLSVTMPAYEQALEQRGSGTPEDASGSFPEASGQLQEATLQAARELAAATGLSPAAALDKAASAVLQSLGQGTTHAAEALPTADASVAPPADGSAAVPPQPLPDQVGGWLARAQALVSRALAAILGGEGSSKPDHDIAAEVPPVDGLVSAVDKPSIPGSASALAGGLFPVEPSLVSDMWPLEAPLDSRQQGSLAPSAASTANRKNNAAAVLAAGVPALAPAPQ